MACPPRRTDDSVAHRSQEVDHTNSHGVHKGEGYTFAVTLGKVFSLSKEFTHSFVDP